MVRLGRKWPLVLLLLVHGPLGFVLEERSSGSELVVGLASSFVVEARHLLHLEVVVELIMTLGTELANGVEISILLSAENYCFDDLSPLSVLVSCGVVEEVGLVIEVVSSGTARWVDLLQGIGVEDTSLSSNRLLFGAIACDDDFSLLLILVGLSEHQGVRLRVFLRHYLILVLSVVLSNDGNTWMSFRITALLHDFTLASDLVI